MRRRKRRRYTALIWMALVVALGVGVNAYLALRPASLEQRLTTLLDDVLETSFRFDSFALNWFGEAEVKNFVLEGKFGSGVCVRIGTIRVVPRLLALLTGRFEADHVVLDDAEVNVSRDPSGRWNFEGLLDPARPRSTGDVGRPPDLVLRRCKVTYVDKSDLEGAVVHQLRDVRLTIAGAAPGLCTFEGQLTQRFSRRLVISGSCAYPPRSFALDLRVRASKVDLGAGFDTFLPPALAERFRSIDLQGKVDLFADLRFDIKSGFVPLRVSGSLVRCHASLPGLPFPLRGVNGEFLLRGSVLDLWDLQGEFGRGRFDAAGHYELDRSFALRGWNGSLEVDSIVFDQRLGASLPPAARRLVERFHPRGSAGLKLTVTGSTSFPPLPEDFDLTLQLEGIDFTYRDFPYRVENVRGDIELQRGLLVFPRPLTAECGGGSVTVTGGKTALFGEEPGPVDVVIELGGNGIAIDEKLRNAIPPGARRIWDAFDPGGRFTGMIQLRRDPALGERELGVSIETAVREGRMVYSYFPYEVTGVTGVARFNSVQKRITLAGLQGFHGAHVIEGDGAIELGDARQFKISLRSADVTIDTALKAALPEESRDLIEQFKLEGRVKVEVGIAGMSGEPTQVTGAVDLLEGAIEPLSFPFRLQLASGRLKIQNLRTVELIGLQTPEIDGKPLVEFDGSIVSQEGVRKLGYDFRVKKLTFDDDLIRALPGHLKKFVTNTGMSGTFEGRVRGHYEFDEDDPSRARINYYGTDIRTNDAAVDFGFRIKSMVAKGNFIGVHRPEKPHHFSGTVNVESAWFNRLHLTHGDIDFTFGREHALVMAARAGATVAGRPYRLPDRFVDRLTTRPVEDTFQMSVRSNNLYGGQVDGFLYVDAGDLGDLAGHFQARGLDLSKASRDVFGVEGRNVVGTARGQVLFEGRNRDLMSLVGKGNGVIAEARLVELPLFLGILSLLNLNFKDVDQTFFNEVSLPYTIEKGHFSSDKIEIKSPAISLTGSGKMDFDGNLDLTLHPHIFDLQIPVVDQVLTLLKGALTRVKVAGDLAKPKVSFVSGGIHFPIDTEERSTQKKPLPRDLRGD